MILWSVVVAVSSGQEEEEKEEEKGGGEEQREQTASLRDLFRVFGRMIPLRDVNYGRIFNFPLLTIFPLFPTAKSKLDPIPLSSSFLRAFSSQLKN